ncbi:MAG: MFS transporter [Bacteroidota bacterium]
MTETDRLARPRFALFTLWLLVFAAAGQIIIVAPLLPTIGAELGVEESALGLLVTAYSVTLAVFGLIAGPVSDRFGRRRMILWGSGAMTLALALHGLAESFGALLAVRAASGAAGGLLSGTSIAYIGDAFPANRRGWASGWVMSGFSVGQIIGIPAGIALAGLGGFRVPFLGFGAAMGVAFLLAFAALPQMAGARSREKLGVGSAVASYRDLLARSDTRNASLVYFVLFGGIGLFVIYFPTWLETDLGFTSAMVAGLYALGGVANVLTGPQAGKLSDRIGRKRVIVIATLGVAGFMAVTPLAQFAPLAAFGFFFGIMALTAGRISPLQALLTELVPAQRRGVLMSLSAAIGNGGFAVGAALAGVLYAAASFPAVAIPAALASAGVGAVVWWGLPEPRSPDLPCPPELEDCADRPVTTALSGPCPEAGHMTEAGHRAEALAEVA